MSVSYQILENTSSLSKASSPQHLAISETKNILTQHISHALAFRKVSSITSSVSTFSTLSTCSLVRYPQAPVRAVGGDDDGDDKEKEEEAERERLEAIKEAEERRKEKHRKMEEEREKMRQEIRDKYNIKKKEEVVDAFQEEPNPLMRKKKTPEELAREAEAEEEDEFTKLKNTIETQVNELKSQIESKCVMQ
ncbi:putative synaphin protein [Trypoxylus dichotomus]